VFPAPPLSRRYTNGPKLVELEADNVLVFVQIVDVVVAPRLTPCEAAVKVTL
jgi:hypothetical protein